MDKHIHLSVGMFMSAFVKEHVHVELGQPAKKLWNDRQQWRADTEFVGIQHWGRLRPPVELRNCRECHSTMAWPLQSGEHEQDGRESRS